MKMPEDLFAAHVAILVLFTIAGMVMGAFVFPDIADRMLKYKHKKLSDYWNEKLEAYVKYKEEHNGELPLKSESGENGALAIWVEDQIAQATYGNLTKEQVVKLREAGFKI